MAQSGCFSAVFAGPLFGAVIVVLVYPVPFICFCFVSDEVLSSRYKPVDVAPVSTWDFSEHWFFESVSGHVSLKIAVGGVRIGHHCGAAL